MSNYSIYQKNYEEINWGPKSGLYSLFKKEEPWLRKVLDDAIEAKEKWPDWAKPKRGFNPNDFVPKITSLKNIPETWKY